MKSHDIKSKIISQLDSILGIGIAICSWDNLIIDYENEIFSEWIPANDKQSDLSNRIPELNIDRLLKRLSNELDYSFEFEIKNKKRNKVIKLFFSKLNELQSSMILIKAIDYTKEKELEYLIDSYAKIAERNKRDLEKANKMIKQQNIRMEKDLKLGKKIQMSMMPLSFPAFPERSDIDIYAALYPAIELGGDFLDFFFIDKNNLCFVIGDVSDKGVASALQMVVSKTLIRSGAMSETSSAAIMIETNNKMSKDIDSSMFVTIFLAILNVKTGDLVYTNAGHNPPYLKGADKKLEQLDNRHGPAVGMIGGVEYTESHIKLKSGDLVFTYTDGVTEAMNPERTLFTEDRLRGLLQNGNGESSAEELVKLVVKEVKKFEDGAKQADDIAVLGIQMK